jgi:enolase
LAKFHIADAEQPLARGDLKSLAELRRAAEIPIAAQESVSSPEDALDVLEEHAADLLKIKLTHIGGFQRALQVASIVGAKGLSVVVGQGERLLDTSLRGRVTPTRLVEKRASGWRDDGLFASRRAGHL